MAESLTQRFANGETVHYWPSWRRADDPPLTAFVVRFERSSQFESGYRYVLGGLGKRVRYVKSDALSKIAAHTPRADRDREE